MNMTATACKEKWRNVRSVFLRHIKSSTSVRSHKKMKPYYLFDTMQFLIPYTKVPVSPQNETTPEISYELKHESDIETETSEHHEHENLPQDTSNTLTMPLSSPKQKSKKRAIDDVLIHYLKRKISDGDNISNENTRKREAIKMFLLSLIPELEEFSDAQMKIFKRRALHLIDDISSNHISTPSIYLPMAQAASSLHP
ncbi:hypothetical protein C0J52_28211 [Blattella germanica]|nr:hypothetical protein C0J52_28211 [Blattella germanica]